MFTHGRVRNLGIAAVTAVVLSASLINAKALHDMQDRVDSVEETHEWCRQATQRADDSLYFYFMAWLKGKEVTPERRRHLSNIYASYVETRDKCREG